MIALGDKAVEAIERGEESRGGSDGKKRCERQQRREQKVERKEKLQPTKKEGRGRGVRPREIKRGRKESVSDQDGGERIDEVKNNREGNCRGELLGRSDRRRGGD
ncbi:hypothetical protein Pmani_029499 [Petrolisthes manimaculis]|uniref:Uncharacterized protein n=1 Tax=Petrolisthes manimaculis TaxID=1843537 RepID=A0AAE1TTT5_9EUCA|nr:hypothetical protein Pmani_029499 [Petrolisthes manimaculis]